MSSLNESTERTSLNESIPVDRRSSFGTGTSDNLTDGAYSDEEDLELTGYDDEASRTIDASGSIETGSQRTPPNASGSHTQRRPEAIAPNAQAPPDGLGALASGSGASSGDPNRLTGISAEYTATSYNTPSDGESGSFYGDYSSGYDARSTSYGYGDGSVRSPRSGSELSSTLASFYYENEYVVRARRTLRFLRRPIFFILFSVGGSGVVQSLFRSVRLLTKTITITTESCTVPTSTPVVTDGYPNVPDWLREVRANLPVLVEKPVTWTLRSHGVPVLSELQRVSQTAFTALVRGAKETWQVSGPMIPVGVFLPLFTFGALQIASKVIARRDARNAGDYDFFGSVSNYNEDVNSPSVSPDRRQRLSGSPDRLLVEATPRSAAERQGGMATQSSSNFLGSTLPTLVQGNGSVTEGSPANQDGAAGKELDGSKPGSPAGSQPYSPDAVPPTGDYFSSSPPDAKAVEGGEKNAGSRSRSRTQAPSTSTGSVVATAAVEPDSPDSAAAMGLSPVRGNEDTVESRETSPVPGTPALVDSSPLTGDVVAALVGNPSVADGNIVLLAAVKYGCSAVLLPSVLASVAHVAVPPSINVEYAENVLERAMAVAQRRGLHAATVLRSRHGRRAAVPTVALPLYTHSPNALYVFMPAADEASGAAEDVGVRCGECVYVSEAARPADSVPINECFYDRLTKEKRQA